MRRAGTARGRRTQDYQDIAAPAAGHEDRSREGIGGIISDQTPSNHPGSGALANDLALFDHTFVDRGAFTVAGNMDYDIGLFIAGDENLDRVIEDAVKPGGCGLAGIANQR